MVPATPDLDVLRAFLSSPERSEGTLTLDELHGLLFAFAGGPVKVPSSAVLPAIFGGRSPAFDTKDQWDVVVAGILALSHEIHDQVVRGAPVLPPHVRFRDEPMQNFEPDAPVAAWSRGFTRGLQLTQDAWNAWLPEELFDAYSAAILTLTLFASAERAERFREDFLADGTSLEQVAEQSVRMFTTAMEGFAQLGRTIHEARLEHAVGAAPRGATFH